MTSGYRWASGHISASALTSAFDVTAFPVQSDQPVGRLWLRPDSGADVVNDAAELQEAMTGGLFGTGGGMVTWTFQGLTPKMLGWLITNRFSGAHSALATIRTFDRSIGDWRFFQCRARRRLASEFEKELGGLRLAVEFVDLEEVI